MDFKSIENDEFFYDARDLLVEEKYDPAEARRIVINIIAFPLVYSKKH